MSLSASDERVGVPRALVARDLLDARDPADALDRATPEGRAGGYSYLCAFPGGDACVIETTATTAAQLDLTVHTNHSLDPTVAADGLRSVSGKSVEVGAGADAVGDGDRHGGGHDRAAGRSRRGGPAHLCPPGPRRR